VWRQDGAAIPVVLGKHGLRWGLGLHTPPHGAVMKREGDGCSPAGIFELDTGFGAMPAEASGAPRWPWRQMTAAHAGVDDPASRHYNRIVDSAAVARDWHSAENMMPESGAYRRGVVVRHNWSQLPGAGSCIFLHIRPPGRTSTSGCTAMSARDFLRLLGWLDTAQRPLLVQLPAPEWLACAAAHGLPGPTPARQTTKNAQPAR
jgi:L,D-peptidoglycan transpeptidase YkuD (ErfK/YbiS/YcfS/YnhG family)